MKEPQIIVWKKTKRSEKEVDIKPMIYDMHAEDDGIFLFLATGSEQNLKPDLVMEAFLRFIGENPEEVPPGSICEESRISRWNNKKRFHFVGRPGKRHCNYLNMCDYTDINMNDIKE